MGFLKTTRLSLSRKSGLTLVELLVVIVILAILLTLLFPSLGKVRQISDKIVCMNNLRSLHVSLNTYMQDRHQWPQPPAGIAPAQLDQWWIDALSQYGASSKTWICPTFQRLIDANPKNASENPQIHYMPTQFDDKQSTPFKWPTMPWLVEVGNFHGDGNLVIFSDGSVKTLNDVFRENNIAIP